MYISLELPVILSYLRCTTHTSLILAHLLLCGYFLPQFIIIDATNN